jgi:CheY-like chemotaxis protein
MRGAGGTIMGKRHFARRILVVDDNLDAAEIVAELLTLQGHQVVVACNGMDALAAAGQLDLDVVFLDIGMPDMDGYQVASALRQSDKSSSARIVALTARGNAQARAKARVSGFDSHLLKPTCLDKLMSETAWSRPHH